MAETGEDKLIAVARHIAKTLGHTDTAVTDDILQIFSNFDGRFREKLTGSLDFDDAVSLDQTIKIVDRRVSKFLTVDRPIWSNSGGASLFLAVVDELVTVIHEWSVVADDAAVTSCLDRAEDLLRQYVFRLEEEFKRLIEGPGDAAGVHDGGRYGDSDSDCDSDDGFEEEKTNCRLSCVNPGGHRESGRPP